jgi:hypothetical protein
MFPRVFVSFSLCMSPLEICMLNALGSCIMSVSLFVSCLDVTVSGAVLPVEYGSNRFILFV